MPGLDDIALPFAEIGPPSNRTAELVWMRLWKALSVELNLLSDHVAGDHVALAAFDMLAPAAEETGEAGVEAIAAFVRTQLAPLVASALEDCGSGDMTLHALLGWQLALTPGPPVEEQLRERYPAVHAALAGKTKDVRKVLNQRMWRGASETQLQANAARGLRSLVGALTEALAQRRHERIRVPSAPADEAAEALARLLSPTLLDRMGSREVTQVQRRAYPRLARVVERQESMLVLAPPGSGKSWIGQVVAAHAVQAARRKGGEQHALILVPTKAMVRESHARWLEWVAEEDPKWRVVAGSADDREYDEALAEGDYDVGIAVYEKLAALLFSQREVLDRVGVIVVDEAQNLGHQQKGLNLEALLTVLRLHWPHIPLVGLSATMNGGSVRRVCQWLGVRHLVETHARSTDLRVQLFDGVSQRSVLYPGATDDDADPLDTAAPDGIEEGSTPYPLSRPASWKGRPLAARATQLHVKTPILHVLELLDRPAEEDRRIICFVRDRDRAADVASLIHDALSIADPQPPVPAPRNPWLHGRYASAESAAVAEEAFRRLHHVDSHRWRSEALEGLLAGVAYHTGALQADLRQILEEEFKSGLLRVLVCTETLAEGVNLPASDVVLVDLTRFAPQAGGQMPIGLGDFRNRIGRAGRLGTRAAGVHEQGHAWVFVDPQFKSKALAASADDRIVNDIDTAWQHWIEGRAEEELLESALADPVEGHANLCGLVLRALAVQKRRCTRAQLIERIEQIMAATYWATLGGQADAAEILDELAADDFLEASPPRQVSVEVLDSLTESGLVDEEGELLQITRLGLAVARSSLPLGSSLTIRRIAAAAPAAGTIALLVEACQDFSVTDTLGKWLGWKVDSSLPLSHRDDVMKFVHAFGSLYAHPDHAERQRYAEFWTLALTRPDGPAREVAPKAELIARSPEPLTDTLREWILSPPPPDEQSEGVITPQRAYATAVLRSMIAYEWASFQPWEEMYARLQRIKTQPDRSATTNERKKPRPAIAGSPSDVTQLAERIAYLLSSASEFVEDSPEARQRLRALAEQLKSGVPSWLLPLWKLRERGLTREVLLKIDQTRRRPTDDLEQVLTSWQEVDIDQSVRDAALTAYRAQRESQEARYQRVPRRLEGHEIESPDGRRYAAVFVEFMALNDVQPLADATRGLLFEHAVTLDVRHEPGLVVASAVDDGRRVELCLVLDALTSERLHRLLDRDGRLVVVPMKSPTALIEAELDELDGVDGSAISPRALFVVLAELRTRFPQHADLTPVFLAALTGEGGFVRHGQELVDRMTLPVGSTLDLGVDDVTRLDQLFGGGQAAA